MSSVSRIDNSTLINLILVDAEIRPAMLIQPINFGEWEATDVNITNYMNIIKKHFPNLKYSNKYEWFQGVIVSKHNDYNNRTNINNLEMGQILGYPGAHDFDIIMKNEMDLYLPDIDNQYTIELMIDINDESIQLFSNRCIGEASIPKYQELAKKANDELTKPKYNKLLTDIYIQKVYVKSQKNISVNTISESLIHNNKLSTEELSELANYIWNLGDLTAQSDEIVYKLYEHNNPIHNGMLICILISCDYKYCREKPIFGKKSSELTHMEEIQQKWFKGIIELFICTRRSSCSILDTINSYIGLQKKILYEITHPLIKVIYKVINGQPLSVLDRDLIYTHLIQVSDKYTENSHKISTIYDPTNPLHIGMMLVILLQIIPEYDTTIPLQHLFPCSNIYISFKTLCGAWLNRIAWLFEQTNKTDTIRR